MKDLSVVKGYLAPDTAPVVDLNAEEIDCPACGHHFAKPEGDIECPDCGLCL